MKLIDKYILQKSGGYCFVLKKINQIQARFDTITENHDIEFRYTKYD